MLTNYSDNVIWRLGAVALLAFAFLLTVTAVSAGSASSDPGQPSAVPEVSMDQGTAVGAAS